MFSYKNCAAILPNQENFRKYYDPKKDENRLNMCTYIMHM